MNISAHTNRNKAIVKRAFFAWDYDDHSLCIFDIDNTGSCLKSLSVRTLRTSSRYSFMHTKSIRVHWLHRAACLVAEVESAFIAPLRSAFDAAIEAERLALWVNQTKATQATICHSLCRNYRVSITLFYSLKPKLLAIVVAIIFIIFFNINAFVVIELTKETDISEFIDEDVAVKIDRQIGDSDIN